jgi:hypothetical protein
MEGSRPSGFDMSKMSTAEKMLAIGSVLLLIDSFLPWQRACASDVLGELGGFDACVSFTMWGGSGAWAGVIAGLLTIAVVVVGVLSMTGTMANMNMGTMSADKLVGYLGIAAAAFGLLKFLLVLTNEVGWAAFVGLVLIAVMAYGAWQKIQASGGFSMGGGGTMGGGTMGGSMPPSAPPPSTPPSGGMPPSEPPSGV